MNVIEDDFERMSYKVAGEIPINNIWLLMFYGSELAQIHMRGKFAYEKPPSSMFEFVSKILVSAVERRIHKNLTLGFTRVSGDLSRVRGKIDPLRTESKALLAKGRVACMYDTLSVDTSLNRYVLSALLRAGRLCAGDTARSCKRLSSSFEEMGVSAWRGTNASTGISQQGYMNPDDKVMISAAKLLHDMLLPTEETGALVMQQAGRDQHWLRKLFEKAIGGFYRAHLDSSAWDISTGKALRWQISNSSAAISEVFPQMRTDIILCDQGNKRKIVIDTKFTSILKRGYQRAWSLNSAYIYQMYAYLFSQAGGKEFDADSVEGILLHPSIGYELDEFVKIQGRTLRFCTVDLTQDASGIISRLTQIAETRLVGN